MSGETSARLGLPMLQPGQAQKELTHNEALALIDLAVQASVMGTRNDPPAAPAIGESWIVGVAPTGAWAGSARAIAGWSTGGWRFVMPGAGFTAWNRIERAPVRYDGIDWTSCPALSVRAGAIAVPTGGATVDAEARAAITSIVEALRGHGLIAA